MSEEIIVRGAGTDVIHVDPANGAATIVLGGPPGPPGIDGEALGIPGDDGADGMSAYEIAVDEGFVGDIEAWLLTLHGAKGDTGNTGLKGDTGNTGLKGDKGDKGDAGDKGDKGDDGDSAYQVALDNGFVGNQAAWLVSIKGDKGDTGDTGDSITGPEGPSAYDVAVDEGFVGTVEEWLDSLVGGGQSAYEAAVELGFEGDMAEWLASLRGEDGDDGTNGDIGPAGASAYDVAVNEGFVGTEEEWLITLKGDMGDAGPEGDIGPQGESGIIELTQAEYDALSPPDDDIVYVITDAPAPPAYVETSGGGKEDIHSHGNTGSTETIDLADGNVHIATQNMSCTYTFTGSTAGVACAFTFVLEAVTGTATWPASVDWADGTVPTLSGKTVLTFLTYDNGTTWLGFFGGKAFA